MKHDDQVSSIPNLVLYDGDCGVCNKVVKSLLKRDRRGVISFAPIQGETALEALTRHGKEALIAETKAGRGTMILVQDFRGESEALSLRSTAVLKTLMALGGFWKLLGVGLIVPSPLRNWAYDLFARNRARFIKQDEACLIPTAEQRKRLLP